MFFILSFVISTLSFSSTSPACLAIWNEPSTIELKSALEGNEAVILRDIFTTDANHNAAIVQLLLIQTNLRFEAHVDRATYESQRWIFDLLRVHLYGVLVIEGEVQPRGNYYPSETSITWHHIHTLKYFSDLRIPYNHRADLTPFKKLLDRLQSATP